MSDYPIKVVFPNSGIEMKLYERKNEHGATVEWYTQRNSAGNYFSIFPHYFNGKYAVIMNAEDKSKKILAEAIHFEDAEKCLRVAENVYC